MNKGVGGKLSLEALWYERLSVIYPGEFQKPLTQKERGQLKMLANKVGPQTREVIVYAVNDWSKFADKAASQAGLATWPTRPHIGFLLAHHHVAMNMMLSAAAREKKKAEAKATAEMEALKPKPVPKPEEIPMTPEEKAAAYKEFLEQMALLEEKQASGKKQSPWEEEHADFPELKPLPPYKCELAIKCKAGSN